MLKTSTQHNVRRRREIAARWRALELVERLGEQQVETALGIARSTIHRWKTGAAIPSQAIMVALESLAGQTYHMMQSAMWKDWHIGENGRLHGPGYKYGLHGGDLLGWWYQQQMIPNYRKQIKLLKEQLAAAYEELAQQDLAANERAFTLGEQPPPRADVLTPVAPARRHTPIWIARARRR